MNDFETVREELNADDHNERTMREANAALDRIEAEVERLQRIIQGPGPWAKLEHAEAEVERLRVDRDEWKANGEHWRAAIPALEVEIERLQDKLDGLEGAKYE